jgi:hypothetical protein
MNFNRCQLPLVPKKLSDGRIEWTPPTPRKPLGPIQLNEIEEKKVEREIILLDDEEEEQEPGRRGGAGWKRKERKEQEKENEAPKLRRKAKVRPSRRKVACPAECGWTTRLDLHEDFRKHCLNCVVLTVFLYTKYGKEEKKERGRRG